MGTQLVENYCKKDVFSVKRCLLPCDVSIPSPVAWLLTACPRFLQFLPSLPRVPVLRSSFPGEDTSPTFLRSVSGGLSEFPAEVPASAACWLGMRVWEVLEVSPGRCHSEDGGRVLLPCRVLAGSCAMRKLFQGSWLQLAPSELHVVGRRASLRHHPTARQLCCHQ